MASFNFRYDIISKANTNLIMNRQQKYYSDWGGNASTIHPGHVVTFHYANLLLNYVTQNRKKKVKVP